MEVRMNDAPLKRVLGRLQAKAKNLRPAFVQIGNDVLKRSVLDSIERQRDPVTGQPYPALASITTMSRRGGGGKALFDTGRLLRSFASATPRITDTSVSVGTSEPQARLLNNGGTVRAKGRYLAIPLGVEFKKAGSAKRWFQQAKAKGLKPFVFTSKKGNTFIAYMKGATHPGMKGRKKGVHRSKPGKMVLAFLLRRTIRVPRRRFAGIGPETKRKTTLVFRRHFQAALT